MSTKPWPLRHEQRGLTLIEMMVSIAIGLVVVGAVTYVYVGSKGSYRGNESLARIQEAGRFALDSMTKDIRRAGAMGCGSLSSITSNQPVVPSVIAPAGLVVSAIQGYTPAPNYTPVPLAAAPAGWVVPTPATGPAPGYWGGDVLQLQIASGVPARMSASVDTANGNITIADNTVPNFKLNDYALVADCSSAAIFQITAPPTASGTATLLSYVTGGAVPALPPISVNTFPTVQHFDQVTYYLGKQLNGRPALYRYSMINGGTAEEVVDNVEDMDIVYGVDTTPTDSTISADLFEHADAVTAAGDWPNVVSVRISLIGVGDQLGVALPNQQFPSFHGAGAALTATAWIWPDTRLRQVFSASAALRDRLQ